MADTVVKHPRSHRQYAACLDAQDHMALAAPVCLQIVVSHGIEPENGVALVPVVACPGPTVKVEYADPDVPTLPVQHPGQRVFVLFSEYDQGLGHSGSYSCWVAAYWLPV